MSKYTRYYNKKQCLYKGLATKWAKWAETAELTENETVGITKFFAQIAKRFGLIKEFKDIGVL